MFYVVITASSTPVSTIQEVDSGALCGHTDASSMLYTPQLRNRGAHQCRQVSEHLVVVHEHFNNIFPGSFGNESKTVLSRVFNESVAIVRRQLLEIKQERQLVFAFQ